MRDQPRIGWIGCGRMGSAMAKRLIAGANELHVTNRTRSRAEILGELGARVVDNPLDLADCDVVFVMVSADAQLLEVLNGPSEFSRTKTSRHASSSIVRRSQRVHRPRHAKPVRCAAANSSPLR